MTAAQTSFLPPASCSVCGATTLEACAREHAWAALEYGLWARLRGCVFAYDPDTAEICF